MIKCELLDGPHDGMEITIKDFQTWILVETNYYFSDDNKNKHKQKLYYYYRFSKEKTLKYRTILKYVYVKLDVKQSNFRVVEHIDDCI